MVVDKEEAEAEDWSREIETDEYPAAGKLVCQILYNQYIRNHFSVLHLLHHPSYLKAVYQSENNFLKHCYAVIENLSIFVLLFLYTALK